MQQVQLAIQYNNECINISMQQNVYVYKDTVVYKDTISTDQQNNNIKRNRNEAGSLKAVINKLPINSI